nr:mitogen activated protein kinase kinase kinase 7 [Hymenolepis microstoma]
MAAVKWFQSSVTPERRINELQLLRAQNHPNIIELIAAGPDIHNGVIEFLCTEFTPIGDLHQVIHRRDLVYSFSNAFSWMLQLSEALSYLHEKSPPIVHRDVKPANCLLFELGSLLKLCDFGSAERISESADKTLRGTQGFMSPELFREQSGLAGLNYSEKSDVFSAAMTFWEICSRQFVIPQDEPLFVTILQLVRYHRRPKPLSGCPPFLQCLLERCWDNDPDMRPRMTEIVKLLKVIKQRLIDIDLIFPSVAKPPLPPDFHFSPTHSSDEAWEDGEDGNFQKVEVEIEASVLQELPVQLSPPHLSSPIRLELGELITLPTSDDDDYSYLPWVLWFIGIDLLDGLPELDWFSSEVWETNVFKLPPKTAYYQAKPALKRLLLSTNRYAPQYISLVQRMGKSLFTPISHARPNSLIRAYNSISTLVRFRVYSPLKSYNELRPNFVRNLRFNSIKHWKYLSKGGYGAVLSGQCPTDNADEVESEDLAIKGLYNYYVSSTEEDGQSISTSPSQWALLHKHHNREVNLRPSFSHPNIVPILKDFFECVSSCGSEMTAELIERFPEGFGANTHTFWVVMPRFDGSLEDLLEGKWKPIRTLSPNIDSASFPTRQEFKIEDKLGERSEGESVPSNPTFSLPPEEAVGITVQMFEAIAVLELRNVSHRDIKPSNFLVKSRSPPNNSNLLNGELAKLANTRLRIALTDFGCAIRNDTALEDGKILSHSGNSALWAPEVAEYFTKENRLSGNGVTAAVYKRSDLWATATLVYQLFGESNPFLLGKLQSKDYEESQLPAVPEKAPSVLAWLLAACLRRDPSLRPPAYLVADILHTWCLLQLLKRILPGDQYRDVVPRIPLPAELLANNFINSGTSSASMQEVWSAIELQAMRFSRRLRQQKQWFQNGDNSLRQSLRSLLELLWTADLLLGPAKATLGIRYLFYQRVKLERFAYCLAFIQLAENRPLIYSSQQF